MCVSASAFFCVGSREIESSYAMRKEREMERDIPLFFIIEKEFFFRRRKLLPPQLVLSPFVSLQAHAQFSFSFISRERESEKGSACV